jgi:hypothetical protein
MLNLFEAFNCDAGLTRFSLHGNKFKVGKETLWFISFVEKCVNCGSHYVQVGKKWFAGCYIVFGWDLVAV